MKDGLLRKINFDALTTKAVQHPIKPVLAVFFFSHPDLEHTSLTTSTSLSRGSPTTNTNILLKPSTGNGNDKVATGNYVRIILINAHPQEKAPCIRFVKNRGCKMRHPQWRENFSNGAHVDKKNGALRKITLKTRSTGKYTSHFRWVSISVKILQKDLPARGLVLAMNGDRRR